MNIEREAGEIEGCTWPSAQRLACRAYYIRNDAGTLVGFTRLFAVNADGTDLRELTARLGTNDRGLMQHGGAIIDFDVGDTPGAVLMTRHFLSNDHLGSHIGSSVEGLGVELVDTASLNRTTVEQPRDDAVQYISDGHGKVRIMGQMPRDPRGYVRGTTQYLFRMPDSRQWLPLAKVVDDGGISSGSSHLPSIAARTFPMDSTTRTASPRFTACRLMALQPGRSCFPNRGSMWTDWCASVAASG